VPCHAWMYLFLQHAPILQEDMPKQAMS